MLNKAIRFLRTILLMGVVGLLAGCCSGKPVHGLVILTEIPASVPDTSADNRWQVDHCRIVSVNKDQPEGSLRILTDGFYSARAPQISYDGRFMLFAGKRGKEDAWQIWETDLQNLSPRQVTAFAESCMDPVYLPGDRIAFSKRPAKDTLGAGTALFTCSLQGTETRQITFHPHDDFAATVLADGRILAFSSQIHPVRRKPSLLVFRPDGTKGDLFYRDHPGKTMKGRVSETASGLIYFIESDSLHPFNSQVASLHQNSPFHTRSRVTSSQGDFQSVFPLSSGKLLVAYRNQVNEPCALYECDPLTGLTGKPIYSNPAYSIVDVMVAEAHSRPRKLPSEVDMEVKTGLLMCQDINFRDRLKGQPAAFEKASRIEILGMDTSYGIVNVEGDGSFYLKTMEMSPSAFRHWTKREKLSAGRVLGYGCGPMKEEDASAATKTMTWLPKTGWLSLS